MVQRLCYAFRSTYRSFPISCIAGCGGFVGFVGGLLGLFAEEYFNFYNLFINPEIIDASQEMIVWEEGCLSVPTIYDKVDRHARVRVRALNRDGQPHEFDADELLAVCVQHELDHLMGKVFVEYLSPLKRNRIKTKLVKRARDESEA